MKVDEHQSDIFNRISFSGNSSPVGGEVNWDPVKSIWWIGMFVCWLSLGSIYFSFSSVLVFVILCSITLCLGHSIGMHRKLIHNTFQCPKWVERTLVYLGTLVGLGGPFTMMNNHDVRDWAQRRPKCHGFLSHQQGILKDFYWQLHCKLTLDAAPQFRFPKNLTEDRFYQFLQSTSMLQQIPLAILLYILGDWGWVAWGICGRICISIFGHWLVGYFAHNQGHRDWHLEGASVQGYNIKNLGLITFGECWHNNHHAFPDSAKLGLSSEQFDPGWHVLCALKNLGLAWDLKTPEQLSFRPNLIQLKDTELANDQAI